MSIVKDMLREERRLIIVMTFNDDSSALRPPPSSPSMPSKCVRQFMSHILLSAEMHNFPSGVAPFPGAETGKTYLRRAGHECEGDGEHGGLLCRRAEHPRVRAAVGGDSDWARAADPRDGRLEGRIRSSSASR